jgi:tRNA(Arg) A34 adenosine deaminase TadA
MERPKPIDPKAIHTIRYPEGDQIPVSPRVQAADAVLSPDLTDLIDGLKSADQFAAENVRQERGGPFGAALFIWDQKSRTLEPVGGNSANAVLSKGFASAHAEAENLSPENLEKTRQMLAQKQADGIAKKNLHVVQLSTGESCPACRTKQIMFTHQLIASGDLAEGAKMQVAFGATYEETQQIAGFNDLPYDDDIKHKPLGQGMTGYEQISKNDVGIEIRTILESSSGPVAVLSYGVPDGTTKLAVGTPSLTDFTETAEIAAIRAASRDLRQYHNVFESWNTSQFAPSVLYTKTEQTGPLTRTESQWGGVTKIVSVTGYPDSTQTRESPIANNETLLGKAQKPYNHPESHLVTQWFPTGSNGLENKAQKLFRQKTAQNQRLVYNGIEDGTT